MIFNVEMDSGHRITGYLVPDSFSGQSSVVVFSEGRELLRLKTNEVRDALVSARRHETGLCGFTLDENNVPGLSQLTDLSLVDADTEVLIYRRPDPSAKQMRVMRLETSLYPLWELDKALRPHFRYTYPGLEKMGRETVEQIFHLNDASSFYVSGRLLIRQFEHLIDTKQMKLIVLLRDPYCELAERLLVLKLVRRQDRQFGSLLGTRDTIFLEHAIEFASEVDLTNDKALRRGLRRMPEEIATALCNPLVRGLTAQTDNETLLDGNISAALETLATCAVVGLRSSPNEFRESISAVLEVNPQDLPLVGEHTSVTEFGQRLTKISRARDLMSRDLELYQYVVDAMQKLG